MDWSERRKFPRVDVDFKACIVATDATGNTAEIMEGTAVNISREGICLKTSYAAPISSLIFISILYHGRDSLCLAEVKWTTQKEDYSLCGLHISRWTWLDPTMEREVLNRPIDKNTEVAPASLLRDKYPLPRH